MINDQMEKLYSKHYRDVYLYAFSLCKNHHLAQDLTSDTFFKAYLSIDDTSYIKYWLLRVCKNLYVDHLRKSREYSGSEILEQTLANDDNPLDRLIETEKRKYLYNLIINLKDSYKEFLILYYFFYFSVNEISQSMNITVGAAKTMLFRARKKLKKEMEAHHEL